MPFWFAFFNFIYIFKYASLHFFIFVSLVFRSPVASYFIFYCCSHRFLFVFHFNFVLFFILCVFAFFFCFRFLLSFVFYFFIRCLVSARYFYSSSYFFLFLFYYFRSVRLSCFVRTFSMSRKQQQQNNRMKRKRKKNYRILCMLMFCWAQVKCVGVLCFIRFVNSFSVCSFSLSS